MCRMFGNLMGQRMGKLEYGDESQECVVVCHEMVSMPSLDEVATPPSRQWPVARVTGGRVWRGAARRSWRAGRPHCPPRSGARGAGRVPTRVAAYARTNVPILIIIKTHLIKTPASSSCAVVVLPSSLTLRPLWLLRAGCVF